MLGIDDDNVVRVVWPTIGTVKEFDFGDCQRLVEVIRGKHKDQASGLMCVDVEVTDTIFDQGIAYPATDLFCWECAWAWLIWHRSPEFCCFRSSRLF